MNFVYAFPNTYPYNELLLSGKLAAKTRNWRWKHTGLTLLYTSTSTERWVVAAHHLPTKHDTCVLVGYGFLKPVRLNSVEECDSLEGQFLNRTPEEKYVNNHWIIAGDYRYEFSNLTRFKKPVPFKPQPGSVRVLRVPVDVVMGHIPAKIVKAAQIST